VTRDTEQSLYGLVKLLMDPDLPALREHRIYRDIQQVVGGTDESVAERLRALILSYLRYRRALKAGSDSLDAYGIKVEEARRALDPHSRFTLPPLLRSLAEVFLTYEELDRVIAQFEAEADRRDHQHDDRSVQLCA
jgi:hypothetical protein